MFSRMKRQICGPFGFSSLFIVLLSLQLRSKLHDISFSDNKQLLDEVEHDIMNYQSRGLCYLPKPKAEADNTDTRV